MVLSILFAVGGIPGRAEVRIQKILSYSTINHYQASHLVLIDFWATWCAPCINISKQLEITQEIFKNDLTIISLSNETESEVQKFIETRHPKLTIALDAQNQTFEYYQVNRAIPYSVLLNQRGELLWKGHPADLSNAMLAKFIRQNSRRAGTDAPGFIIIEKEAVPNPAVADKFVVRPFSSSTDSHFIVSAEGIDFLGKCSKLLSEILKKSRYDIRVAEDRTVQATISAPDWNAGAEILLNRVMGELGLSHEVREEETQYYRLTVQNPELLWEETRVRLGDTNGSFLIGDGNIIVDNASVADFCFRLSEMLDRPVYTGYESPARHDWDVHYKFFDLMREQLSNEYGIRIELRTGLHQVHYFR